MSSSGLIFFDDHDWEKLLPLSYTRSMAAMRIGILTIQEKWRYRLAVDRYSHLTKTHLQHSFPMEVAEHNLLIKANLLPDESLISQINALTINQAIIHEDRILVLNITADILDAWRDMDWLDRYDIDAIQGLGIELIQLENGVRYIDRPEQLFLYNQHEIDYDFGILSEGKSSMSVPESNQVSHSQNILIEEGAIVEHSILNASTGPIYIGKNAKILDGCMLRGPIAIGDNAVLKMGAKIYGATTIGPNSKIGGEVKNVVVFGNTNKSHEGYLGNAVLGEWCNLGADTNASNLKNDYSEVKLWSYDVDRFRKTSTQFCGLIMGDHSKTGINTMFNTGTVVGVSCNLFGAGYHKNFVPSFSWGGPSSYKTYRLDKAKEVATRVWERKGLAFSSAEKRVFDSIFEKSAAYRR